MLFAVVGLVGCPVAASDGRIGSVKDFLFDDQSWKMRWMAVDTGHWLPGREVLIHPSAITPFELPKKPAMPSLSFGETLTVRVELTKQQIEASPEAHNDQPVTKQKEAQLCDYYGCDRLLGTTYFGAERHRHCTCEAANFCGSRGASVAAAWRPIPPTAIRTYVVLPRSKVIMSTPPTATSAISTISWPMTPTGISAISSSARGTGGRASLCSWAPYAVTDIDWLERRISVNVTRDQVRSAPAWEPLAAGDQVGEQQLHRHFGWPGYGWF